MPPVNQIGNSTLTEQRGRFLGQKDTFAVAGLSSWLTGVRLAGVLVAKSEELNLGEVGNGIAPGSSTRASS